MPKRSDKPLAKGPRSRQFPLPSYYGLTGKFWSRIEKLALEQADLREREAKNNRRRGGAGRRTRIPKPATGGTAGCGG